MSTTLCDCWALAHATPSEELLVAQFTLLARATVTLLIQAALHLLVLAACLTQS